MPRHASQFGIKARIAAAGLACAFAAYGQSEASISGHLTDPTGAPIAGIAISLIKLPSSRSPEPKSYHVMSTGDGFYRAYVPSGSYRICAEEAQGYLDPCQWQPDAVDIMVSGRTTHNVVLQRGWPLSVHIIDATGLLIGAPPASVSAPTASVSITDSNGKTRLIPFRKTAGGVHEFSVVAPTASYTLNVASSEAAFAGPDGAIGPAGSFSALVNIAVAPAVIALKVTGK